MIIDTEVSIALKNSLGLYDIRRISIFKIDVIFNVFEYIYLVSMNKKGIQFKIKCPICEEYHSFNYNVRSFLRGGMTIGGCEKLGEPIIFIGPKEKVEDKINKYREVNENMYVMI